jgi:hypothetical protein
MSKFEPFGIENMEIKFPNDKSRGLDELPMKVHNTKVENKVREQELSSSKVQPVKRKEN